MDAMGNQKINCSELAVVQQSTGGGTTDLVELKNKPVIMLHHLKKLLTENGFNSSA